MATKRPKTKRPSAPAPAPSPRMRLDEQGDRAFAVYADVFTVFSEPENGLVTLSFYQSEIPGDELVDGGTQNVQRRKKARIVSRIVLSQQGMRTLLKGMADNQVALGALRKVD